MTKTATDEYLPDPPSLLLREADTVLADKLTSHEAANAIAGAIRSAAFDFDQDDQLTLVTADEIKITDADEYRRGYVLLEELAQLESRVTSHYARFDKPLGFLVKVVQSLRLPQSKQVAATKAALSKRLGTWKAEQDARDAAQARAEQEIRDAAARAAQVAKAETLERVAAIEPNPQLADSFRKEAEAVRAVDVKAAPVEVKRTVPQVSGGYTRATWRCEFVDLKELMRAYVDGKCFIPDEALIEDGLQSFMDKQAANLTQNLGKAFPGTRAVSSHAGVARRRPGHNI
jgi:hypothetical protein